MIKKATVTILTVLAAAAAAAAQQAPEEVTDNFVVSAKPPATLWISVVIATIFVLAAMFVAFKDPRRTHLDEHK